MTTRTTGVYERDQKPVRVGLYKVRHPSVCKGAWQWSWWDGMGWCPQEPKKRAAQGKTNRRAVYQSKEWRGRNAPH